MRRLTLPLYLVTAALMAGGGALHLRDWLRTYRAVPWEIPGAWVVRVGFPLNAAASFLFALLLVVVATKRPRLRPATIAAAVAFQSASLAALVLSRHGGVFGWTEPGWTMDARQVRALELATIAALGLAAAAGHMEQRARPAGSEARREAPDAEVPSDDAEGEHSGSAMATAPAEVVPASPSRRRAR